MDLGPHSPKVPVMQLRSLRQPLIKYIIGNGLHTFLWPDNWHPLGPLYDKFGESVVYTLGRSLSSKVSTIIQNEDWKWPHQRNRVTQSIMAHTPSDFKPDCGKEDSVVWLPHPQGFSKLNTRDRLLSWGMVVDGGCTFCNIGQESHHHLFFQCPLSVSVWSEVWRRSSIDHIPPSLTNIVAWFVQNVKGTGFKSSVLKTVLAATVYTLWMERNQRIFQQKALSRDQLVLRTVSCIREALSLKRDVIQSQVNRDLRFLAVKHRFWAAKVV
ncbi:uncharacterized protein LOC131328308 [Rhododendron vialii]|uniref:uncharacterized protein LOC131328308 n=1 Tax=Rhododendron vialii TaxID=182163 RepID=UPI00265F38DB|nr:uncharacterized protein LOC131328308 [Rhododendron vialii]